MEGLSPQTVISSQSETNTSVAVSPKKDNFLLLGLLGLTSSLLIIFAAFIFFYFDLFFFLASSQGAKVQYTNTYGEFPLKLNNPSILRAYTTYELRGKILSLQQIDKGFELTSDITDQGENLKFIVTTKTKVSIYRSSVAEQADIYDLKEGQSVDIIAQYHVKENFWEAKVVLVNDFPLNTNNIKAN